MLFFLLGCALTQAAETTRSVGSACVALPIEPAESWPLDYDASLTTKEAFNVAAWSSLVLVPTGYEPMNAVVATVDGRPTPVIVACRQVQTSEIDRWRAAMCESRAERNKAWVAKGWPAIPFPAWCE